MKIVMKTSVVKALLDEHKERHQKEYVLQMRAWRTAMKEHTQTVMDWANGKRGDKPREPQKPTNFIDSYNKLLDMINHHIEDNITLNEEDFRNIVEDKFGWSGSFNTSSIHYGINADMIDGLHVDEFGDLEEV